MGEEKNDIVIAADKLILYDALIKTNPAIQRKGLGMPYTSLKGNMFSFLAKDGVMGLRLPKEERENFIKKYKSGLCEAYGAIMKEYVSVPDRLLNNTRELKKYFEISYEYVKTLKPKTEKKVKTTPLPIRKK